MDKYVKGAIEYADFLAKKREQSKIDKYILPEVKKFPGFYIMTTRVPNWIYGVDPEIYKIASVKDILDVSHVSRFLELGWKLNIAEDNNFLMATDPKTKAYYCIATFDQSIPDGWFEKFKKPL